MDTTGGDLSTPPILSSPLPGAQTVSGTHGLVNTSLTLPVATCGDPTDPVILFSLPDLHELLHDSDTVARIWPALASLRGAAKAAKPARFRMALTAMVAEARLVFGSCFLLTRASPAPPPCNTTRPGRRLHSWITSLLAYGSAAIPPSWHWSLEQCLMLHSHLLYLVAASPPLLVPTTPDALPIASIDWSSQPRPYPATLNTFLHTLRVGLPWTFALAALAYLPLGHFSPDGRVFCTPSIGLPGGLPDKCLPLCDAADPDAFTLFFSGSTVIAICSSHSVLPRPNGAPSAGLRVLSTGAPSRFLPEYLRLKKTPTRDVMSVFMKAANWHQRLGPLDAVAATVVEGRMTMPKPRLPLRHSRRPNHASWERNEAAKIALGPKVATWTWQGVVEMIPQGCPVPLFIEPLGAVDKATAPWWRLILDARISNEYQDPWGVWYFSIAQLAALLDYCDIMFAEDLEDAYHLSIFSGCTGKPFWSCVFSIDHKGEVVRRWRLVMGCDPYTCLGLCDKAMSGFCIDGFVGRFAAAHFGQRNAGSPLNALMRAIQRFLARRSPPPPPPPTACAQPAPIGLACGTPAGNAPFFQPSVGAPPASPGSVCGTPSGALPLPVLPTFPSSPVHTRRAPPGPACGMPAEDSPPPLPASRGHPQRRVG